MSEIAEQQSVVKEMLDGLIDRRVRLNVQLGTMDIRLTGELLTRQDGGYLVLVEDRVTYALFDFPDVHYIDSENGYISTKFAKGFIEYLPTEEDEWPHLVQGKERE